MSKNTFSACDGERSGLSCHTLAKRQNGVFCLCTANFISDRLLINGSSQPAPGMGLTGLEPVTLRLSSACSNQLSYRPDYAKASSGKPDFSGRPTFVGARP